MDFGAGRIHEYVNKKQYNGYDYITIQSVPTIPEYKYGNSITVRDTTLHTKRVCNLYAPFALIFICALTITSRWIKTFRNFEHEIDQKNVHAWILATKNVEK